MLDNQDDVAAFKSDLMKLIRKHDLNVPGAIILLLEFCETGFNPGALYEKLVEVKAKLKEELKAHRLTSWAERFQ